MRRLILSLFAILALSACASAISGKSDKLYEAQNAYSGAVRWGDFEGAWSLVDPEYRRKHPVTPLQLARYDQVQVSSYRDLGSSTFEGTAVRDIQIGVVNRHTLAERSVRYRESWRWDEAQKRWWLQGSLPDFWDGE